MSAIVTTLALLIFNTLVDGLNVRAPEKLTKFVSASLFAVLLKRTL
jgi:uncharacterized membrane protein YvlD (DUF360 family)